MKIILVLLIGFLGSQSSLAQTKPLTLLFFPQIAVGRTGDGGEFVTLLVVSNPSVSEARGNMVFTNGAGGPLRLRARSLRTGQVIMAFSIGFTLGRDVTAVWELNLDGALTTGYAIVGTSRAADGNGVKIAGTAVFILKDGVGNVVSSAGVGSSAFTSRFSTPVLKRQWDMNTGVAVVNFDRRPNTLRFELTRGGRTVGDTSITLAAFGHTAKFVDELFGMSLPSELDMATLKVTTPDPSGGMVAVVIQLVGSQMTTFPVIAEDIFSYKAEDFFRWSGQSNETLIEQ